MSIVTDILDRLSGVATLKDRIGDLTLQLGEMRRVMLDQQKELAQVQGQSKALIQIQSHAAAPAKKRAAR